jgi:hypothetical protein
MEPGQRWGRFFRAGARQRRIEVFNFIRCP